MAEYNLLKSLEEGDKVTKKVVNAYNDIKESSRRVYHTGRPAAGDEVIHMVQNRQINPGTSFVKSYPLPGVTGKTISAILVASPEREEDRDLDIQLIEGGVGTTHFKLNINSGDSGYGNPKDPYLLITFGKK